MVTDNIDVSPVQDIEEEWEVFGGCSVKVLNLQQLLSQINIEEGV